MDSLIIFFIFIFGSIIGSFLNVLILRYNTGLSVVSGRSSCFSCGKQLGWHNMLPIFSFALQKGKCSSCFSKISWQYPLVELLTAILFTLLYLKFGLTINLLYYYLVFSLLISIAVYDIRHKVIPDDFVYPLIALAFIRIVYYYTTGSPEFAVSSFLSGGAMFLILGSLWWVSSGLWMGFGDAKLVLALGWLNTLCYGFTAFIYSFWIGAVVGIFTYLLWKTKEVPFAPFLIAGFILIFFYDSNLFSYLGSTACIK